MAATQTHTDRLTLINITDGDDVEYMIMNGESVWGWVGRITIHGTVHGTVHGFQLVHWGTQLTTVRMRTWQHVANFIAGADPRRDITRSWSACTDLYAAEEIDAYVSGVAQQRAREQADADTRAAAEAAQRAEHATRAHAVATRAAILYHGSRTNLHGQGRIVGWCACDTCDLTADQRVEIETGGYAVEHVRFTSLILSN